MAVDLDSKELCQSVRHSVDSESQRILLGEEKLGNPVETVEDVLVDDTDSSCGSNSDSGSDRYRGNENYDSEAERSGESQNEEEFDENEEEFGENEGGDEDDEGGDEDDEGGDEDDEGGDEDDEGEDNNNENEGSDDEDVDDEGDSEDGGNLINEDANSESSCFPKRPTPVKKRRRLPPNPSFSGRSKATQRHRIVKRARGTPKPKKVVLKQKRSLDPIPSTSWAVETHLENRNIKHKKKSSNSKNEFNQPSCSGLSNPTQLVPTTPVDVSAPSTSRGVENLPTAANSERNSNVATKRTQPRNDSEGPPSKKQMIDEICRIVYNNFDQFKKVYEEHGFLSDTELEIDYTYISFKKIVIENIVASQSRKHFSSRNSNAGNIRNRTKNPKTPTSKNSVALNSQQPKLSMEMSDPLYYAFEKSKTYIKFYFKERCDFLSFLKSYETLLILERRILFCLLYFLFRRNDNCCDIDRLKNFIKKCFKNNMFIKFDAIDFEAVFDEFSKIGLIHIEVKHTETIQLTKQGSYIYKMIIAATCPFYEGRENGRLLYLCQALIKLGKKEASLLPLSVTSRVLFKDVVHFEEYITSLNLLDELNEAKWAKIWERVSEICKKAFEMLKKMLNENNYFELFNDNTYHRQFTAAAVLTHCLSSSIDILKNENKIDQALRSIELLLGQEYFVQQHRADWYYQKVLIYERRHCSTPQIMETFKQALQDDKLSELGRRIISRKALYYTEKKNKKISNEKIHELEGLRLSLPKNIYKKEFYVKPSEKKISDKDLFEAMKSCNPDSKYRIAKGPKGFKDLVLLLFYPVIYETRSEMFVSEMQYLPLDWGDANFYKAREEQFKERCRQLISYKESKIQNIIVNSPLVKKDLLHHLDGPNSHIKRQVTFPKIDNNDDLEFLMGLLKAMTVPKFVKAAIYLLKNFDERKFGFPSITMYSEMQCQFVEEILRWNSDLTDDQVLWIEKLNDFGLTAFQCTATDKIKCRTQKPPLGSQTPNY